MHALNRTGSHDYQSQSCTGVLAASLEDTWQVAYEIAVRAGGDPGWPGLTGPERAPPARKPRRLAFLETAGWAIAGAPAKQCMEDALARIRAAGVKVLTRTTHAMVDAIEPDIAGALELSIRINDFEMRCFIRSCADRDIDKLSPVVRERLPKTAALTIADYRSDLTAAMKFAPRMRSSPPTAMPASPSAPSVRRRKDWGRPASPDERASLIARHTGAHAAGVHRG